MLKQWTLLLLATGWFSFALAQSDSIVEDKAYYLQEIQVNGAHFSSPEAIRRLAGLQRGWLVLSGPAIPDAIKRLWREQIFEDLSIDYELRGRDTVSLAIKVTESYRLAGVQFTGLNRTQQEQLSKHLDLTLGTYFGPAQEKKIKRIVRNYFVEKGYYHTTVEIKTQSDAVRKQSLNLTLQIKKGKKARIAEIQLLGQEKVPEKVLKKAMRPVQEYAWWKVWVPARFKSKEYHLAKQQLIAAYQEEGYQDARILQDSLVIREDGHVVVQIEVEEGSPYVLRDVQWSGNHLYTSTELDTLLKWKVGMTYSPQDIERRLYGGGPQLDVSSMYLERGHLFFQAQPVVSAIEGDSVDLQIRILEGTPAWIRTVRLQGNTKTADHVILRELDTRPGDQFSRMAIMRSQRKLMALNYFAPEGMDVLPQSDPKTGAVDLVYKVEEKSTDKFQLSGGWSPKVYDTDDNQIGGGFTGTIQLVFNNFSTRRLLDRKAWNPVPSGDGQQLSLAIQSNGGSYTNFAASYQEPWLGGTKPNFLGVSTRYELFNSLFENGETVDDPFKSRAFSFSLDYGTRFAADDFTRYYVSLGYKRYDLENPGKFYPVFADASEAVVNSLALTQEIRRNNLDNPTFPTDGMDFSLSLSLTPPYSLFENEDSPGGDGAEEYRWLEYYKWKAKGDLYKTLGESKLVLHLRGEMGYVGAYDGEQAISPFERYNMGGYGLLAAGNNGFMGTELVPLRGYPSQAFTNNDENFPLYHRYVVELRYPLSIPGGIPVWLLGFAEAGNAYTGFDKFDPANLKRSAGLGFRTQLPAIGLFGLDWGYGFDPVEGSDQPAGHQFHIILGREF